MRALATFVGDCPRCGTLRTNFDCYGTLPLETQHGWRVFLEIYLVCRVCHRSSIFLVYQKKSDESLTRALQQQNKIVETTGSLNDFLHFERVISVGDRNVAAPPEDLPNSLSSVIIEGNKCISVGCWNAAAAMYRLALDLATKDLLPENGEFSSAVRDKLAFRLEWLFNEKLLPLDLKSLAECVRQDGNDGAHDGNLTEIEAKDLQEFATEMLRRLYSEPARIKKAEDRRLERRGNKENHKAQQA